MNKRMMSGKKSILSVILSLLYLFVAPVMQVLPVYAAEPAEVISVWEVMETQLVGANSIITDQAVVNAYASNLGSIAAEGATAEVINIGMQNAASQCGVDLGQLFANTSESAAAVGVNAAAASAGENIAASCAAATTTVGSVILPALGGVVVAAGVAGITAGLIHIGKCVNEIYRNTIEVGQSIKNAEILENITIGDIVPGGSLFILKQWGSIRSVYYPGYVTNLDAKNNRAFIFNPSNTTISATYNNSNVDVGPFETYGAVSWLFNHEAFEASGGTFISDFDDFKNKLQRGEIQLPLNQVDGLSSVTGPLKYDPDATTENDPEIIIPNIPELRPLPDYANNYGLAPIPEADYQNIVTYINNQPIPDTLAEQEEQKETYPSIIRPIIDPYIVPIGDPSGPGTDPQPTGTPDPNPNPNPTGTPDPNPNPNPTGTPDPNPNPNPNPKPDTQPFPDPETVPQPTPVVNPTPDSDVVPAPVPYPDPETPTEQDKTDTDAKITPIDLRDKFPFCIPFDIVKIMKLFQGGREAPCFTWEIPFGQAGSGSVTVDLSPWDSAATLLRTLELILFIMLLAVGTRNLIGGSG